jgi:DNA invertase Pin-like site-specific DNA recombinase
LEETHVRALELVEGGQKADPRPYAVYARLSRAATTGDLEKCEHQVELCRTYASSRGLRVADAYVYQDNNLSAWKKRVRRPSWDALMAAAARGEVAGILVYAVDRFCRRPKDLEALIELAEEHGISIEGPRSGRLDLTTATGRQQARWMALQAASESDNTSERIRTTLARKMAEGKPMGAGRSFGFEVGGQVQRASEVAIIREVAQRMLAGEPSAHIADDLNARKITTSRDGEWTPSNLTRLMARPRNGGLVEHHGRIVGRIPGEPVLDQATYEALSAQITSRRRGRRPTGRWLLTGLLTCEHCGHSMNGATLVKQGRRVYRCPPQLGGCGRIVADAAGVEAEVSRRMAELSSEPDRIAAVSKEEQALTEARSAQLSAVEAIEEQLVDLEAKLATGDIIARAYDAARPILDKRLAAARAKLDGLSQPVTLTPIQAAADWAEMTDAEKRSLIKRFRVRIVIGPHTPGVRRFDPSRVKIHAGLPPREEQPA